MDTPIKQLRILFIHEDSSKSKFLPKLQSLAFSSISIFTSSVLETESTYEQNYDVIVIEETAERISTHSTTSLLTKSIHKTTLPVVMLLSVNALQDYSVPYNSLKEVSDVIVSTVNNLELQYRIENVVKISKEINFRNEVIQLKDQVLAIIAHDLKNVFVGLQGLSKNLSIMTDGLNEDTVDYFSLLESGIDQGYLLLINLLEWSKLQSGRSLLNLQTVNLSEISLQNISLLHPMSYKKIQNVRSTIDPKVSFFGDKNMISSVIRNLTNNAIKFTPDNGTITLAASVVKEQNTVTISINDTGIGISEEQMKKLFLSETNDSTLGTDGEIGTGLGLLLCKDLVQRNGGSLWVESTLGNGTTFFFTVPIEP